MEGAQTNPTAQAASATRRMNAASADSTESLPAPKPSMVTMKSLRAAGLRSNLTTSMGGRVGGEVHLFEQGVLAAGVVERARQHVEHFTGVGVQLLGDAAGLEHVGDRRGGTQAERGAEAGGQRELAEAYIEQLPVVGHPAGGDTRGRATVHPAAGPQRHLPVGELRQHLAEGLGPEGHGLVGAGALLLAADHAIAGHEARFAHGHPEVLGGERLGEQEAGAFLHGGRPHLGGALRGDEAELHVVALLAKRPEEVDARQVGHVPVGQHQVGLHAAQHHQGRLTVGRLEHLVEVEAGVPEGAAHQLSHHSAVVDQQDLHETSRRLFGSTGGGFQSVRPPSSAGTAPRAGRGRAAAPARRRGWSRRPAAAGSRWHRRRPLPAS